MLGKPLGVVCVRNSYLLAGNLGNLLDIDNVTCDAAWQREVHHPKANPSSTAILGEKPLECQANITSRRVLKKCLVPSLFLGRPAAKEASGRVSLHYRQGRQHAWHCVQTLSFCNEIRSPTRFLMAVTVPSLLQAAVTSVWATVLNSGGVGQCRCIQRFHN